MEPRDFMYWLSGLLEDSRVKTLDETRVKLIREHMALVMTKVTGLPAEPTPDLLKALEKARPVIPSWSDYLTPHRTALIC